MTQFRSFEDMECWREGRLLVKAIRSICRRENACRDYPFIDQVTRASRSISANIAEGCDALTNDQFIAYLGNAKRSASEIRSHLYDAMDEGYISPEEFRQLTDQCKKIQSMLAKLIHHLQSLPATFKRTFKRNNELTK